MKQEKSIRTSKPSPSIESVVVDTIRRGLESYSLRYDVARPPTGGDFQLGLPFDGDARSLPEQLFPVDIFEINQQFFSEGRVDSLDGRGGVAPARSVWARSQWVQNDAGCLFPVISVTPEHFGDDDVPSAAGRFVALRELARLIRGAQQDAWKAARHGTLCGSTSAVHGGEFLLPSFFEDPLNRWAMHLGCPPIELERMLQIAWGYVPVPALKVQELRPICVLADEGHSALDAVFMEMEYEGKTLNQVFGLSPNALIGWCRHRRLIDW